MDDNMLWNEAELIDKFLNCRQVRHILTGKFGNVIGVFARKQQPILVSFGGYEVDCTPEMLEVF